MGTFLFASVILIATGLLWIMIDWLSYAKGYKRGQIDALNGKFDFVLIEFEDGTRHWYRKKELKDLIDYKIIIDKTV